VKCRHDQSPFKQPLGRQLSRGFAFLGFNKMRATT